MSHRLLATVSAVRELMVKRLEEPSLGSDAKREMQIAIEELDVMWEELQAQAALLLRETERYAEFFEYAPDAYVITDAGGSVREANQAAIELFAAARGDVIGRPLSDYVVEMPGGAKKANVKPAQGTAREVEFSVRTIALKKSEARGLCWLLRPTREEGAG